MTARLLRLIAAVPPGQKLSIGRFARELNSTQAVVFSEIQKLVERGQIDPATMRAPSPAPGRSKTATGPGVCGGAGRRCAAPPASPPSAAELLAEVDSYCERTGTPPGLVGKVAFNHPGFVPLLRKRGTLRAQAAAEVRAVLDRYPDGIGSDVAFHRSHEDAQVAAREAEAACRRRAAHDPGAFDRRDGVLERVTGAELLAEVERFIFLTPGMTRNKFDQAIGGTRVSYNIEHARFPKPATVKRIRDFIARHGEGGEPIDPSLSTNTITETRRAATAREDKARIEGRRELGERSLLARRPGETLAEAVKRHAAEREDRFRNATRLTTRHPLGPLAPEPSLEPLSGDDPGVGEWTEARRSKDLEELASPSSVLRRAQRDWPDQCERVRAIAAELGVQLGEAWRRVIAAGVETLSDPESI